MIIKKLIEFFKLFFTVRNVFFGNLIILCLLLFRNPFSERTLIPNLEPYPDTINYLVPVRNFIKGNGFEMSREFGKINLSVPPLYSFFLIPFYLINQDVRMFYFANILMSLISLYLIFKILQKITGDKWIIGFTLFLFVTNYFIYWYPQWAMAENLILPLFLGAMLLVISEVNLGTSVLAGLVTVSFFAAKYAAAPLSLSFFVIYLFKLMFQLIKTWKKTSIKNTFNFRFVFVYIFTILLFIFFLLFYLVSNQGFDIGKSIRQIINILPFSKVNTLKSLSSVSTGSSWYSLEYFKNNLPKYLLALIGNPSRLLWDYTPIILKWVGTIGIFGLLVGFFNRNFWKLSISSVFMLFSQIVFISIFYSYDNRYIYPAIVVLIFGVAVFLTWLKNTIFKKNFVEVFYLALALIFSLYFISCAIRIKKQIMLNIKYAETPWTYISVLKLNGYFEMLEDKSSKPVVISPLPPYYIDYYSNGNYDLLPLSPEQEFRKTRERIWGPGDYSNLINLYKDFLEKGRSLYVSTYGLGNEGYLHEAFGDLENNFHLEEVYNGCYTQCRILKVELKK